jgi:regulatory protein
VGEAELAEAIERLVEAGAIDDEHFAFRYAEDKRALARWGPDRIREALSTRGIAPDLIEAAIAAEDASEEVARAEELLAERAAEVDTDQGRARALALLARRGYPLEVAYEAVRARERAA